ncbi:MAG: GNAT family N-acetyltransferase [Bacteroidota bacterium]
MEKINIRDYKPKDYQQIQYVWRETGVGGSHRGDNKEIIEGSIEIGGKLIVLEDTENTKIFGTSWITFDGRRLHLHHIAVLPEYQKMGYGKLLTKKSVEFAKDKGYQIKLEVHSTNKSAIEIYKNIGFERLGDYDIYIIRNLSQV